MNSLYVLTVIAGMLPNAFAPGSAQMPVAFQTFHSQKACMEVKAQIDKRTTQGPSVQTFCTEDQEPVTIEPYQVFTPETFPR